MSATTAPHRQFGELIRRRRLNIGLTQTELGEHIGVTQQMIGQYESGESTPSLSRGLSLLSVLDIPISQALDTLRHRVITSFMYMASGLHERLRSLLTNRPFRPSIPTVR